MSLMLQDLGRLLLSVIQEISRFESLKQYIVFHRTSLKTYKTSRCPQRSNIDQSAPIAPIKKPRSASFRHRAIKNPRPTYGFVPLSDCSTILSNLPVLFLSVFCGTLIATPSRPNWPATSGWLELSWKLRLKYCCACTLSPLLK